MGWIEVDDEVDERLRELGRRWGVSKGDALARVLQERGADASPASAVSDGRDDDPDDRVPVYFDYKGVHNAALFDPSTGELEVTAGPASSTSFPSPSAAATNIVGLLNPSVSASRNGWITWRLVDTDEFIERLRPGASS